MKNVHITLENIRSLHNIGAIFRTCSFFGIKNILLTGYSGKTKNPKGNILIHPNLKKTALGAEKDLNIVLLDTPNDLIKYAQEKKLDLISIEQHQKSIPVTQWQPSGNEILVFGNEVDGIDQKILNNSTKIIEISRYGKHSSLNVTTACGIILFQLTAKQFRR